MSTVWRGSQVLLREPWSAVAARVGRRVILPVAAFALAGVPGSGWDGVIGWTWLRVLVIALGILGLALWLLAFANVARNKRVLLLVTGTGSIERPPSLQERWLRMRLEYVVGPEVTVTVEPTFVAPSAAEPRITLAAEGSITRVPMYGRDPSSWVTEANALLASRGVRLVLVEPGAHADEDPGDAPGAIE